LESSFALFLSKKYNCLDEIIIIIAILEACEYNIETLFINNDDYKKECYLYFKKIVNNLSDHITLLNIYNNLYKKNINKFLNIYVWNKISLIIENLIKYSSKIKTNENNENEKEKEIKKENIEDKILYVLMKANSFNLIENTNIQDTSNKKNKNEYIYKTVFYLNTEKAIL